MLFLEYIEGSTEFTDYLVEDQTNRLFGNASTVTCSLINSTSDGQEQFVCVRYNYWFAILTLAFIYLPSVNVIATLYGPETAGWVGIVEGIVMAILGGILAVTGYFVPSPGAAIAGWFIICLGAAVFGLGVVNVASSDPDTEAEWDKYHWLLFIPLLTCAPGIFIIIKLLTILKANNPFIQSQATYGSWGEAILEAAPQLGLQLYIILLSMSATDKQWLSVITSAATISLPAIENYISARGGDFGLKSIIKNIFVFLPACLFKILSVSILAVFLRWWVILVIVAIIIVMLITQWITDHCYDWADDDDDDSQQGWECLLLSWLTLAGLRRTKAAAIYRLVSTLTVTIIYSLILGIIMAICNMDPDYGHVYGAGLSWSELELVKDSSNLNLLIGSTIGLGWVSFILDIILAWCKSHEWRSHNWGPLSKAVDWFVDEDGGEDTEFWNGAVLLQGLQFIKK